MTARLMASLFRQRPGPDVDVTPSEPAKEAPMALQHPDISSSHCTVTTPRFFSLESSWSMSVAGVMGYEPK